MFHKLVDSLPDGVTVVEQSTGKIEYSNEAARTILGDEYGSVGRTCYFRFTHACLSCESCNNVRIYSDLKNNRRYEVTEQAFCEGEKKLVMQTYRDVTEQWNLEREHNEQTQILAATLEHSDLICWEYDFLTHTCYHSDRMAGAFMIQPVVTMIPEEIGRLSFIFPEDRGKVQELYNRLLYGEDKVEDEIRLNFETGIKRCNVMLCAIYNEAGQRAKAVGMIQNVEELRGLEECFNVAAIQNEFSFFIYDVKRDEVTLYQDEHGNDKRVVSGYMKYLNSGASAVHPDDIHYILEGVEKAKHGSKGESRTLRFMDASSQGYKRMSITFGTSFDNTAVPVKLYGTIRDVSKREQRERIYSSQLAYIESYRKSALAFAELNISKGKILNAKSRYAALQKGIAAHSIEHYADVICELIPFEEKRQELRTHINSKALLEDYEQGRHSIILSLPLMVSVQSGIWVNFEVSLLLNPVTQDVEGFATMRDITQQQMGIEAGKTIVHMEYETVAVVDAVTEMVDEIYGHHMKHGEKDLKAGESYEESAGKLVAQMDAKDYERVKEYVVLKNVWNRLKEVNTFFIAFTLKRGDKVLRKRVTFTKLSNFKSKVLIIFQDVSDIYNEEHEKQKILKKALKEAKMAENAKIDFLSRMSHDLRTPLNGIMGMTDIALDEVKEESIKDYLEKIYASGQLLLSLVNDILDISQLEDNRMRLRMEPYSMQEFLESIERIIVNQCAGKGITYHCEFGDFKDATILTDKLRFGQIFMNLLSNAVKYTEEEGDVFFSVETKDSSENKKEAVFTIRDTGIGMSPEFVKQAFDAFSQEKTNSIDERIGSGLGLSIVKQLVELFGGHYEVQSEVGKGTTVRVYLTVKLVEAVKKNVEESLGEVIMFHDKHVLVAEDQPLNAKIITKLLEKRGICVTLAENGQEALDIYLASGEYEFDAVLMDVRMPVMDGIEATRKIRQHKERLDCYLPIIAATANAFVEDKIICLEAGMNEHISKPINPKELFNCLSRYFKN